MPRTAMVKAGTSRSPLKVGQTSWNLKTLFRGDNDPRRDEQRKVLEQKAYAFINAWKDRDDYLTAPDVLRQALDEYEVWKRSWGTDGNEGYYFWLRTQQDQNDPKLKAAFNKIEEFSKKIENDSQFFHLRVARIRPEDQQRFLEYGPLKKYRHFLERVFAEARYHLSEPEEKILNLKSATSYANWTKMTAGFLAKEERVVALDDGSRASRPFSEIVGLMNSGNRKVRDTAAAAFNSILSRHADVAEAELNSVLQNKKIDDELRGTPRPDTLRHLADDIESDVVDALVGSVAGRFSIPARYYELKAQLLNVKKLRYHERNVEFGAVAKHYPYGRSVNLVHQVMGKLDPQFAAIFSGFVRNGQIDAYPKKGKDSGAFCIHHLMVQPTYILLNHTGKMHDVLTIAHELGHGINNELIREKQHALDFGTPTSTAEVASTFMEDFVLEELLHKADDEQRLAIMMQKLNDDVSSIFRQVACYRFEQELHQEFRKTGYLPRERIGGLFTKHMAVYMGSAVEQSEGSGNWWVYWSHIRYFFYVYSYASGLLISKSLQSGVKQDPAFINKVKEFLAAGLSDSPRNIFARLGIDISDRTFWNRGLDEVERLLNETTELAERLGKIRGRKGVRGRP
ncbi:MAG TPA: M3 family oligoendopeptidase [Nitrospirota bacterium]|nr:M3 family oligoendopeptidase [Nitrospirota bacterium]